jgi:Ca2+-binding RTX toxin-like protein
MLSFNISGLVLDGPETELLGLSDIDLIIVGGGWKIVVSSEAEGAITTFGFGDGVLADVIDTVHYGAVSGTRTVWDMTFVKVGDTTVLLPATRYEDQAVIYTLDDRGAFGSGRSPGEMAGIGLSYAATVGGKVFVYTQSIGGNGVTGYAFGDDFGLVEVTQLADTKDVFLGDVSAFASAMIAGQTYLFVASAFDAGLLSYRVTGGGALVLADIVAPGDLSGFSRPQALLALDVGDTHFLVMAAAGSSSLTVFKVQDNGNLVEVEHMLDTSETRFQGAALLEQFQFEGRQFLVAAGSDDGITILEVTGAGQLRLLGVLADTYDITLDNISGLAAEVIGGKVVILVSSATDHGFTQIEVDMGTLETAISGSARGERITGTSGSDIIYGMGGNDTISGRGGNDLIVDGVGSDILIGEGGKDVFRFVQDGMTDEILDLSVGYDQIDLSEYAGIRQFSDIALIDWCDGVMIVVNGDLILVRNQEDHDYAVADFGPWSFIF